MEQDSAHVAKMVEDGMVTTTTTIMLVVKEEVAVKEEVLVAEEASTSKVAVEKPRPSRWEMVMLKDYLKLEERRSRESFWTSCPVRLVMSGLQGSTITADQAAQLLGVSVGTLARRFMKEEKVEEYTEPRRG